MATVFSATLPRPPTTILPKSAPSNFNHTTKFHQFAISSPNFQQNAQFFYISLKFRAYAISDSSNNADEQDDYDDAPLDSGDEIETEIEKTGKNSRRIRSKVAVQANLQTLWDILTDYERLADFIPGLAVSQLIEKREKFARLYQIGEQSLAFGLKFNAKGTIDCFERDFEDIPFGRKRDIEFKMVEGDFQLFEGKWSVEQEMKCSTGNLRNDSDVGQEFQTTLIYVVDVKPKLWLPVRLVEGRLCKEIRTNLSCIRDEAEKVFQSSQSTL